MAATPRYAPRGSSAATAELIRLERQRIAAEARERIANVNAQHAAEEDRRRFEAEEAKRRHEREMEARRLKIEASIAKSKASAASAGSGGGGRGYSQFTPPQSFISGGAATRISGAPNLLDVGIALAAGAVSSAWVVTRNHSTGGDLGWAFFLGILGVGLAVEGHGELHDVGVGLLGAQSGYLATRLLGGTQQPGA